MMSFSLAIVLAGIAIGQPSSASGQPSVARPPATALVDFSREVRPILSKYCFQCHGPDDQARKARLRLDERESALKKLRSGSHAIVPGRAMESEMFARVTSTEETVAMPPAKLGRKLTAAEVDVIRRWIDQGAAYTKHWALVPPVRHPAPRIADPAWAINPIDSFILARLKREGLRPAAAADRYALIRRASIDLTGLPPTLDEAHRFVKDDRPGAYERAVDALLAKPAYGERWASMWLDLARYGDSAGYLHDPPRTIWRWRDWVVRALNENMSYDRLTIEMLAGDLLPNATTGQIIATGFHRNTTTNTEGGINAAEYHHAAVVDRVNTTMQVWMGSTFACAQCHNHKYDPFSQKEYFQIFAIFNSTADFNSEEPSIKVPRVGHDLEYAALLTRLGESKKRLEKETRQVDVKRPDWERTVERARLSKDVAAVLTVPPEKRTAKQNNTVAALHRSMSATWSAAAAEVKQLETALEPISTSTMIAKEIAPRETYVALRGVYKNRGERVAPGTPAALHPSPVNVKLDRLGLARWLVDPANPLVARVAVNRLWQEIFGIGIVESSEEFGLQGDPPSHPELLDWLATEYIRLGWDTKRLLKLIVTSAAYRQSSQASVDQQRADPSNRLLSRGPRLRLSAEALRDQALAVSGLLNAKLYGPPVQPFQPVNGYAGGFTATTDWATSQGEERHRRALYTRWRRNLPYPSMVAFDVPDRAVCSLRRTRTNTSLQALVTLNDPVFVEAAQALARRILTEGGATPQSRARFGFRLAVIRPPTDVEVQRLVKLYEQARAKLPGDAAKTNALANKWIGPLPAGMDAADAAAWTVVSNVLLNLDEVLMKR